MDGWPYSRLAEISHVWCQEESDAVKSAIVTKDTNQHHRFQYEKAAKHKFHCIFYAFAHSHAANGGRNHYAQQIEEEQVFPVCKEISEILSRVLLLRYAPAEIIPAI